MTNRLQSVPPYLFSVLILVIILVLTLTPDITPGPELKLFPHVDKVVHFLMFGSLAASIFFDIWRKHEKTGWSVFWLSALLSSGCGGIIELLQEVMNAGRSGDWYDFMADFAGAFVYALISIYICNKWKKTTK